MNVKSYVCVYVSMSVCMFLIFSCTLIIYMTVQQVTSSVLVTLELYMSRQARYERTHRLEVLHNLGFVFVPCRHRGGKGIGT